MSTTETEPMNTETTENITTIITEDTGVVIAPPRRKRVLKKAAEPSMKEATELAEGKTLVIKEEEKPANGGAGQPEIQLSGDGLKLYTELRVEHDKWRKLYLELKEKTDPLLAKLEEQRQKRNEASKKSKKAARDKTKKVKTELEERVKKLEEKVLEKDFKEVLDEKVCKRCEREGWDLVVNTQYCSECWMDCGCADCDNHEDDITDENPLCSDCRAAKEEQSDAE